MGMVNRPIVHMQAYFRSTLIIEKKQQMLFSQSKKKGSLFIITMLCDNLLMSHNNCLYGIQMFLFKDFFMLIYIGTLVCFKFGKTLKTNMKQIVAF